MTITIHTDGGSRGNPGAAAIGVVALESDSVIGEIKETIGTATNNEAEYAAFIVSAEWLLSFAQLDEVTQVTWKLDSKLVVEQLNKNWKIKEPRMKDLAEKAWALLSQLNISYTILYVPRAQNAAADALVNQALDAEMA